MMEMALILGTVFAAFVAGLFFGMAWANTAMKREMDRKQR